MPRRLSPAFRAFVYGYLVRRDGEWCQACLRTPAELKHPLEVDHIDGHATRTEPDNVMFLCKQCNVAKESALRGGKVPPAGWLIDATTGELRMSDFLSERDKTSGQLQAQKDHLGFPEGGAQTAANSTYEPRAVGWILRQIDRQSFISLADAVNGSAQYTGANPQTTRRYIDKLAGPGGPLLKTRDMLNTLILVREGQAELPTPEDTDPQLTLVTTPEPPQETDSQPPLTTDQEAAMDDTMYDEQREANEDNQVRPTRVYQRYVAAKAEEDPAQCLRPGCTNTPGPDNDGLCQDDYRAFLITNDTRTKRHQGAKTE